MWWHIREGGNVYLPNNNKNTNTNNNNTNNDNIQEGENVYLPYETKGKFSAIAKEENISGVHNIRFGKSIISIISITMVFAGICKRNDFH